MTIIPDKLVETNRKENFSLHLAFADGRDDEGIHLSRVNASVEITDTDSESVLDVYSHMNKTLDAHALVKNGFIGRC